MINTYPLLHNFDKNLYLTELIILPELVKEIQAVLKEGGFFFGVIDGYLNIETVGAFKKFKQSAYLEYPDVLGESTVDALLELAGQRERTSYTQRSY